ncbi:THAP domain-containing protein 6-like [Diprion similis]|uniref:THAP domain-containing protein 6-like n=1 Tax=Diprion similis TaxID=362088 RepID=UPI001EF75710|nr:THAP domain-containing protein 6-like [Diprion similis]
MGRCVSCKKSTTEKGLTFHRFPANEIERQKWIEKLGKPLWVPAKTAVLCSNHFTSNCFERWWNITRLRKGSVPTIFPQAAIKTHISLDEGQVSHKKLKVDISTTTSTTPTTSISPSAPTRRMNCVEESSSEEAILPSISPEISIPTYTTPTPKAFTSREKVKTMLTPKTSRRRDLVKHDHHYEDTPQTSKKKLDLMRQKYESSQKKVKALKRQVSHLKTTVYSLKKAAHHMRVTQETNGSNTEMLRGNP